jgi:hypothetical protein
MPRSVKGIPIGIEKQPHWGRLIAGPVTVGFRNTQGMTVLMVVLLVILVLTLLTVPFLGILVIVLLILFGIELGFPLISELMGTGPDVFVYENGVVYVTMFGRHMFYSWDRFEGWDVVEVAMLERGAQREIILYVRIRGRYSDPDRIGVGRGLPNPQMAWDHIFRMVPRMPPRDIPT